MALPTMKQLLESGVHFGHQTRRWDPRMKPYIFTERNGIHIIDLQQTMKRLKAAVTLVKDTLAEGGTILFVGAKKQAQSIIQEEAERCEMFYVNQRWMGGMLTNFQTIRRSVARLQRMEMEKASGAIALRPKKEQIGIEKQIRKLNKALSGIKKMKSLPNLVFIVDPRRETIAVAEARRLGIPVIALADTNCNPNEIDYIIPGNDDAIRALKLITSAIADAALAGRQIAEDQFAAESAPEIESDEEVFTEDTLAAYDEDLEIYEEIEEEYQEDDEEDSRRRKTPRRFEEIPENGVPVDGEEGVDSGSDSGDESAPVGVDGETEE